MGRSPQRAPGHRLELSWRTSLCAVLLMVMVPTACGDQSPSSPERSPDKRDQNTDAQLDWGPLRTVAVDRSRPESMGVPAAVFDPEVGTVVVWPHAQDLETVTRPVGEPWGDPEVVEDGADAAFVQAPVIATDGDGEVTAAWIRSAESGREYRYDLLVSTRSPGGEWSAPQVLMSRPLLDAMEEDYPVAEPRLAVGPDGETAIAWAENSLRDPQDEESYFSRVWVAYRPAGDAWQDPYDVRQPHEDSTLIAEDVVVDGDGVAVVAVTGVTGISTVRNSGSGWQEDGEVIRSGNIESDLGVGADGALDITWHTARRVPAENGEVTFQYGVAAANAPEGDDWSEPHQLGSNAKPELTAPVFTNPSLAEHSGTATIVFASDTSPVQAVVRGSDGDYGAPVVIAEPLRGGYYDHDVLGVWANRDGQALVLWGPAGLGQSGGWDLHASYRNGTGASWSPSTSLSGGKPTTVDLLQRFPDAPAVVYPDGAAAVFWSDGQQIMLRELGAPG